MNTPSLFRGLLMLAVASLTAFADAPKLPGISAAMPSPGTYGQRGVWLTQASIDLVKGIAYILMVQRSNFPNSDASDVRRAFQQAAAGALR